MHLACCCSFEANCTPRGIILHTSLLVEKGTKYESSMLWKPETLAGKAKCELLLPKGAEMRMVLKVANCLK